MKSLDFIVKAACVLLLMAGILVNASNILGRYLFLTPLAWAEEFMVFTNIWLIFLGAALAAFQNRHLSMDLVIGSFGNAFQRFLVFAHGLAGTVACGFVTWASYQFVTRMFLSGQSSISLGVPMYLPHAAVLVGFGLMALAFTAGCIRFIVRRGETDQQASEN